MRKNRELNNVRIGNPDGLWKKYREPNRLSPKNMRHRAIREDSSRSFRETVRVAEFRERGRVEKPRKQPKKRIQNSVVSKGASMAGHALLMVTAVVFCATVYVSSLTIRVRPCSSMAHALAFQTSFRNPDSTPLRAELYAGEENYSKDFVGVAYLLFEGLKEQTAYGLDIVNVETEEKIYHSTFLTEEKDPYRIQVENPVMTEEGLFQFGLSLDGLPEGAFYTVYVMDEDGHKIAVLDCSETRTSFSIPVQSFAAQLSDTEQSSGETAQSPGTTGQASGGTGQSPGTAGQPSGGTGQSSGATGQPSGQTAQPSAGTEPPPGEVPTPEQDETQAPEQDETPTPGQDETQSPEPDEIPTPEQETAQLDMDSLPFITVKINGKTFLPRVWGQEPEPDAESVPEQTPENVAESPDAAEIDWLWNEEHTEAEALIPNPENPGEPEIIRAEVTETVVKEAGCETEGLTVYTASAPGENGTGYNDVQTVVIPPKGHNYERVRLDETPSGTSAEYVCPDCGKSYSIDVSATEEPD